MGILNFYVLWSLCDAPRQFFRYDPHKKNPHTAVFSKHSFQNTLTFVEFLLRSKSNRRCFQVHIPLPLPKQLVIFGLGQWKCSETTISVEVLVSAESQPQKIGTLTCQTRYVEKR